jgi:para-nitrobenzyl esterase
LIDEIKTEIKKGRKEEIDMDYLQNLSEKEIINLNNKVDYSIFAPMRDGYIIPEDCYGEVERGAYNGIDIMIGSNADEIRYFILEYGSFFIFNIGFRFFWKTYYIIE